ncbi:MAG TPA: DUF2299 family protein [Chthoniobacterales bacterium]|jgi:hypothetical protein|nr:DUF2299 family protein [Chthoniobacterales bacterium]
MSIAELLFVAAGICLLLALLAIVPMLTTKRRWLAAIFVVIGVGCFADGIYQRSTRDEVTTENIESKVREWLDAFKMGTRLVPDNNAYFNFEVSPPAGVTSPGMNVARMYDHPHYLEFVARLSVSEDDKAFFSKLSESQKIEFVLELRSELAKAKILAIVDASAGSLIITILHRTPITIGLTESAFLEQVEDVSFAQTTANDTIELGLIRRGKFMPQPSPTLNTGASRP